MGLDAPLLSGSAASSKLGVVINTPLYVCLCCHLDGPWLVHLKAGEMGEQEPHKVQLLGGITLHTSTSWDRLTGKFYREASGVLVNDKLNMSQ